MRLIDTKLRELKQVLRALRELADELALLVLACAGLVALIVWVWP